MATENLNTGNNLERKEKSSFSEQIKNLKYAVILALGLSPNISSGQTTTPTDSNKAKIEVVQQGEDPVKDLMEKFNVASVEKIEDLELKDMIAMRDQMLIVLRDHPKLDSNTELINIRKELKFNIEGLAPAGFDLASRKAPISDEEKKRIEEKKKLLAQKTAEVETLNQNIKKTQADIDRTKQVVSILEGSNK